MSPVRDRPSSAPSAGFRSSSRPSLTLATAVLIQLLPVAAAADGDS